MKITRVEKEIGGRVLFMETGKLAKQAHGAVVVGFADTQVLSTVVSAEGRPGLDFFPLTVDYRERGQAAGKIPGGRFMKREGRPSTKEILTMRMTDRPLRPLFPKGYKKEVQIMAQVLSADGQNDPDVLSINGASACLMLSPLPFLGPVGAVRVGRIGEQFVLFPTQEQIDNGDLDLIVAGNADGVCMLEGDANQLPEEVCLDAIYFGYEGCKELLAMQVELIEKHEVPAKVFPEVEAEATSLIDEIYEKYAEGIKESCQKVAKQERAEAVSEFRDEIVAQYIVGLDDEAAAARKAEVKEAHYQAKKRVIRRMILDEGKRCDGRGFDVVRELLCEVGLFPMTHGSALFQRGQTQAVVGCTFGTSRDEEIVEGLGEEIHRKFMLHYNFPPFSVGEVSMPRGPGRRDIGHGALAERSIKAVLPEWEKFPYTIRLVSDIYESNGSSSMASVCGATLALMDAGVPITRPVAGISVGLVSEGDKWATLTDIMGEEDFNGDMDLKIAGSQQGVTGIQLDLKVSNISREIMTKGFEDAKVARINILRTMLETLPKPRKELAANAPRMCQIQIDPEKIGMIIGPGGKMIRSIEQQTGASLDIDDDGTITISGPNGDSVKDAQTFIESMTKEVEIGEEYDGKVVAIKDFGCFVEILPGQEGLVHISELSDKFVDNIHDHVDIGDAMRVRVIDIDGQNRVRLSRKAVLLDS